MPTRAARLEAASTHWLRHTYTTHALAPGAPLEAVQQNAGHASLDTTTHYVTIEAARRMEATQVVWEAGKGD
ncbi:site-specific integrase [Cupriavidus basilensis]|uniref:Site-specific integrase n=1 Tax=Cupriavidus basilensis TaxID=68895 RepID=A0ABT6AIA8_9BURK|nr:site-specific integrase [Cupriavidus basilensis]MDF3831536.1 site-specific integrase [Cupriavidus basilensis]